MVLLISTVLVLQCGRSWPDHPRAHQALSTGHPLATAVGADVLARGGTAFDAAVAVHFALAVCYPVAGNVGGGGFAMYRKANGDNGCIDFRETAPQAAHRDMFLANGKVQTDQLRSGALSSGVPGSVAGMAAIHALGNRLSWRSLLEPAVAMADTGHLLTPFCAGQLNEYRTFIREHNPHSVAFLHHDSLWNPGDRLVQPQLAATLRILADSGAQSFYTGSIAALIASDQRAKGGIISKEDLAHYSIRHRAPLVISYPPYTLFAPPPPSSGGLALAQMLVGARSMKWQEWGHNSATSIHHMSELARRAYADRAVYPGDPDFIDIPMSRLLDPAYIEERMSTILPNKATPSAAIMEGSVSGIESFQTTHYSIVDKWGNAVSVTTTLNSYFGSGCVVRGAGFFMNNEMDDFSAAPGTPNQFGLVGGEANAIVPGKRMLSSMTPLILLRNDSLCALLGTPGGSTIITNLFQVVLSMIEYNMDLPEAIACRKMHAQWLPDILYLEGNLYNHTLLNDSLKAMGHRTEIVERIGMVCGIQRKQQGWQAAADTSRRGDGTAHSF